MFVIFPVKFVSELVSLNWDSCPLPYSGMSRAYYVRGVLERTYIHVRLYTKQRTAPSVAWRREACGREKALVNGLGRKDKTGPLLSSQHWNWFRSYVGENSEKQDGVPLEGLSLSMQPF